MKHEQGTHVFVCLKLIEYALPSVDLDRILSCLNVVLVL